MVGLRKNYKNRFGRESVFCHLFRIIIAFSKKIKKYKVPSWSNLLSENKVTRTTVRSSFQVKKLFIENHYYSFLNSFRISNKILNQFYCYFNEYYIIFVTNKHVLRSYSQWVLFLYHCYCGFVNTPTLVII